MAKQQQKNYIIQWKIIKKKKIFLLQYRHLIHSWSPLLASTPKYVNIYYYYRRIYMLMFSVETIKLDTTTYLIHPFPP